MAKKVVIVLGIGLILIAGAVFISMRRSHMMGGGMGATGPAGGLTAVSKDGQPIPWKGEAPAENAASQELDGMIVTLSINPYPPTSAGASDFQVTLTDASGQPVTDASVRLDLTMPSMYMPPNSFDLAASGAQYQSAGRFTMRGGWRIEVIIERGGASQSVFFDVNL